VKGFARHLFARARLGRGNLGRARQAPVARRTVQPAAALARSEAVWTVVDALESRWLFSAAFDVAGLTALREDPRFVDVDGSDVAVAVLDTGVFGTHPDLQQNVVGWYNAVSNPVDSPPSFDPVYDAFDGDGHGTHVSGIAASSDPNVGVAYAAKLVAVKVLPDAGEAELGGDPVARGLRWVALHAQEFNVRVVNLSLGTPGNADLVAAAVGRTEVGQAIKDLEGLGITVVAASGNSYAQYTSTGAAFPAVASTISVANTWADAGRAEDFGTPFGSSGDRFFAVEGSAAPDRFAATSQRSTLPNQVAAPGQDVYSLWNGSGGTGGGTDDGLHKVLSGTSMAAPFVSGLVALMQDAARTFGGQYLSDPAQVRQIIQDTADTVTDADVPDNYRFDTVGGDLSALAETGLTYKRVNALHAVQRVYDLVTEGNPNPGGSGPEIKPDTDSIRGRATIVPKLDATRQFTYAGRVGTDGQVVVGADDVDLYRLNLTVRGNLIVALSLPPDAVDAGDPTAEGSTPVNTVVRLFDAAGTEVARAVGDAAAGGFATLVTNPTASLATGLYYVGISSLNNVAYDVVNGGGTFSGQGEADYQMVVSLANPDPNGVVQGAVSVDLTTPGEALPDPLVAGGAGRTVTVSRLNGLLGSDLPVVGSPDRIVVSADVDMFRLVAPDDGTINVLTQAKSLYGSAGADTLLKVYDENLTLVAENDNRRTGTTDSLASVPVVRGGIYYVALTAAGNKAFDPQDPYGTRTPDSTPTDKSYDVLFWADNADANGTALSAAPLKVGPAVEAAVGTDAGTVVGLGSAPSKDVDWYTLTPAADGLLRFRATGTAGFVPSLSLWELDEVSGQLARIADAVSPDATLALRVTAGRQLFAAVTGAGNQGFNWFAVASGVGGDAGAYALSASVESAATAKALTNDSVKTGTPTPLAVGQTVAAELGRDGDVVTGAADVDLYAFTAPANATYRFRTIAGNESDADTALRLFDAKGRQLASNDNAADALAASRVTATLKKGQIYYVGVSGTGQFAFAYNPITGEGAGEGSTGTYALAAQQLPPGSLSASFTNAAPLKYVDAQGHKVTLRLVGAGTGLLDIVGADPAAGEAGSYQLTLNDTDPESTLRVTGVTTLGDVRVNGPLGAVRAGGTTLAGNLNVEGTLGFLQLAAANVGGQVGANLIGDAVVGGNFGANLAVSGDVGTIKVGGTLTGGTWDVAGGVQSLTARAAGAGWVATFGGDVASAQFKSLAGSLTAGGIGQLLVPGKIAGGHVATTYGGIGFLDVGTMAGGDVRSAGDIGRAWFANGLVDSILFAGVAEGSAALPADNAAFVAGATISSLYVGKGPFTGTRVAAARIERATLPAGVGVEVVALAAGTPTAAGEPFGLATTELGSLWYGSSLMYRRGKTPDAPAAVGDFVVRLFPPAPEPQVPADSDLPGEPAQPAEPELPGVPG
jgi:subtilisin family serine protease